MNEVSVFLLKPHPQNAEFFPEKLPEHLWNELVADIKENGVINPLIVTPDYTVIAGHLRLEAAKEAGLTHVPVVIRDINPESDEAISMLIKDNLLRRHLNDVQVARLIRKLKEEYGVKHGGDRRSKEALESNGQNVRLKIAEMMGLNERHVRRLDKINNLIPDFKSLLETGKWSATTVASIIGSLPSEEQRKLFASLGESGICGLSVREAQELKKELDSLRKEKESLLERLSDLQDSQKEAEELRAKLKELEARPIEKVVEKVAYKTDPALEAELEAARKQSAELLKRNEFLEARFADIAREKEQKEAKLRQIETEKEMLERQCEHFKKEFLKEKKKPKPDLDRITVLNLMSQIVKSSVDLSSALKTLINKYPDQVLAFARVRGGADLEELGDIVAGTFSFKLLEMSLSDVVQKCMDFFDLLKQKPKLKVLRGGDSPDEGQKSAKEGD